MPAYKDDLLNDLRSKPGYAAKYLSAAYADSTGAFLVALRDVATAQRGMSNLATAAEVNRVNLYRMLSRKGNPSIHNLRAVLDTLRVQVHFLQVADDAAAVSPAAPKISTTVTGRIISGSPAYSDTPKREFAPSNLGAIEYFSTTSGSNGNWYILPSYEKPVFSPALNNNNPIAGTFLQGGRASMAESESLNYG